MTRRHAAVVVLIALLAGFGVLRMAAEKPSLTIHDPAYRATREVLAFARPGLVVKVQSAAIASDGTITARVLFTDPQGIPLDKDGIASPGKISAGSPGVVAAVFQRATNQFTAYTTRVQTSPSTGASAVQANPDTGGRWSPQAPDGSYTYTFATKAPAGFDRGALHAVGVYANRDLSEFNLGIQLADDVYYFTPATGASGADPVDQIKTTACQKCHGAEMAFHGNTGRSSVRMCNLCHTQQTSDPDTGNPVDLRVMLHKIHMGKDLPSVAAGSPYQIVGFEQTVYEWSTVTFPSPIMKCEVCHEQSSGAANAKAFQTRPGRAACGSCHDNVNFETGENHQAIRQANDAECATCHKAAGSDFDNSVAGAHVVPQESSLLGGIQWAITGIRNTAPGQKPTLSFTLANKDGAPLAPADFAILRAAIAGPATDYTAFPRGYVLEDLKPATGANGAYTYTFTNAIPENASGTFAVGLEGRRLETVLAGTPKQRAIQYGATNPVLYFAVDGSTVQPRRAPTDAANCLQCHYRLSLHGDNRNNNIQYCQFCHNPVENDSSWRPAGEGPPQTIDFKFLVHRIHAGQSLNTRYGTDFSVWGFGGVLSSFKNVRFPASLRSCSKCHLDGSANPSESLLSASSVKTPRYPVNPMPPTTTACFGCHDSTVMLSHAQTQTSPLGEACATCHGVGRILAPGDK